MEVTPKNVLKKHDIYSRKYFYPLTADQSCFNNMYANINLDTARKLANQVLSLPIYEDISKNELDRIITIINNT